MALTICSCFRQMRDWKVENLANGKDLSTVLIRTEKEDYLCRQYAIFEQIFWKIRAFTIQQNNLKILVESEMELKFLWNIRSEIVDYLQRQTSFSVRDGTAEISLPFLILSSFQSLISRQQLLQMASIILFGWFADFGETITFCRLGLVTHLSIQRFSATKTFAINCQNVLEFTRFRHEHTCSETHDSTIR